MQALLVVDFLQELPNRSLGFLQLAVLRAVDFLVFVVLDESLLYAGSEMNVVTDEILKSLKSLQVSPCECSAKNPDSDYPNQHTKACPRFQTLHCWCPPATGPGQPHEPDCVQYKCPIIHATIGSYHD